MIIILSHNEENASEPKALFSFGPERSRGRGERRENRERKEREEEI